jgi:NAD-dependent SIR2 family protein deacetylase
VVSGRKPFRRIADELAQTSRAHGLVVFAGAGLSVAYPSSLPDWRTLNTAFLETLVVRLVQFTEQEVHPGVLDFLIQRRDEKNVISPDFQAQLAEDECGADYFRMLGVLDIDTFNDAHAALAKLAADGLLRAVVTTNFDRLVEHSLGAAGVEFRAYSTVEDFESLAHNTVPGGPLPVIKAHGSVDAPQSMVDTLRQRTLGRPLALEHAIATLIGRHVTLVVGFSGADLANRPQYLGLAEGARECPRFVVANLAGHEPRVELVELAGHAGGRGRIVDGTLPDDLVALVDACGRPAGRLVQPKWSGELEYPGMRAATLASEIYRQCTDRLDPVAVANILAALVEAAGANTHALDLLLQTWRHIDRPSTRRDPPFLRYVKRLAHQFIEHGLLGPNGTPLDLENPPQGDDAFGMLVAAGGDRAHPDALADAARALLYRGQVGSAIELVARVPRWLQGASPLSSIDANLATSEVYRLARRSTDALPPAESAYQAAREMGDQRALAHACACMVRALCDNKRLGEADERLHEGIAAADHLEYLALRLELGVAQGSLHLRRGEFVAAEDEFSRAADVYGRMGRPGRQADALIGLLYAAQFAHDQETAAVACEAMEAIVPRLPFFDVELRLWYLAAYVASEQFEAAAQAVRYVRERAEQLDFAGAVDVANRLAAVLPRDHGSAP